MATVLPDGPFRGVPILLKDLGCMVAGEPTAFGIGPLRDVAFPFTSYLAGYHFRAAQASSRSGGPTCPSSAPR